MGRTSDENIIVLPVHDKTTRIIAKWMNPETGRLDFHYNFTYKNFSRHILTGNSEARKRTWNKRYINERWLYENAEKYFKERTPFTLRLFA